jgi:hypothetical protein
LAEYGLIVVGLRMVGARLPDRFGAVALSGSALAASAVGLVIIAAVPNLAGLLVGTGLFAVGVAFIMPALLALTVARAPVVVASGTSMVQVNSSMAEANVIELGVDFADPSQIGAGEHDGDIAVHVCYDAQCRRDVGGSPITIAATYTVTNDAITEPGLDPVPYLSRAELTHDVIDAEYSAALEAIVMVSGQPANALYVYYPASGIERELLLDKAPTCVSVAPDGLKAAVGHDALITYVDLASVGLPGAPAPTLLEVATDVEAKGGRVLRGRSLPYEEQTPYRGVGQIIRRAAGIYENDPAPVAREKLMSTLATLLPEAEVADTTRFLSLVAARGSTVEEVAAVMRRYPQRMVNVEVRDREALERADDVWEAVRAVEHELGVEGRVLVRPSGTEPLVRVMVEAETEELAVRHADALATVVAERLGGS